MGNWSLHSLLNLQCYWRSHRFFVTDHSWHGHIGPGPYPTRIENGQWGGFLHVKTSGTATGSSAAVVYRGVNNNDQHCDWMAAWSNPWNRSTSDNTVSKIDSFSFPFHLLS